MHQDTGSSGQVPEPAGDALDVVRVGDPTFIAVVTDAVEFKAKVRIRMCDESSPGSPEKGGPVERVGVLLRASEQGEFDLKMDDGEILYCWPLLAITVLE